MNMTPINILVILIMTSSVSATILHCLDKWGTFEYYSTHIRKSKRWPEVCILCIGFWISVAQLSVLSFFAPNIFYIAIALASASLTKAIYENGKFRVR